MRRKSFPEEQGIRRLQNRSTPTAPGGASRPSLLGAPLFLFALAGLMLVVGCASRNSRVFQFERETLAHGRAEVSAWNAHLSGKTNALLEPPTSLVYNAARELSVRLLSLDTLREGAQTNGVDCSTIELKREAVRAAHSNLTCLVEDGMNGMQLFRYAPPLLAGMRSTASHFSFSGKEIGDEVELVPT